MTHGPADAVGGPVNGVAQALRGSHDLAVRLDQATIAGLRAMISAGGIRQLAVGDLRAGEVAELAWSGSPAHLRSVAAARAAGRPGPGGLPGGPGAGRRAGRQDEDRLHQRGRHWPVLTAGHHVPAAGPGHRRHAHRRGRAPRPCPGLEFAALGVEDNNPGARHLCQRPGYQAAGRQRASWEPRTTPGSCGCMKPRPRSRASACDARALTTPQPARTGRPGSPFPRSADDRVSPVHHTPRWTSIWASRTLPIGAPSPPGSDRWATLVHAARPALIPDEARVAAVMAPSAVSLHGVPCRAYQVGLSCGLRAPAAGPGGGCAADWKVWFSCAASLIRAWRDCLAPRRLAARGHSGGWSCGAGNIRVKRSAR